jgi:hypothetical protein
LVKHPNILKRVLRLYVARLGLYLRQFLARAYHIKSIADYGVEPDTDVPLDRAGKAIDTALAWCRDR